MAVKSNAFATICLSKQKKKLVSITIFFSQTHKISKMLIEILFRLMCWIYEYLMMIMIAIDNFGYCCCYWTINLHTIGHNLNNYTMNKSNIFQLDAIHFQYSKSTHFRFKRKRTRTNAMRWNCCFFSFLLFTCSIHAINITLHTLTHRLIWWWWRRRRCYCCFANANPLPNMHPLMNLIVKQKKNI